MRYLTLLALLLALGAVSTGSAARLPGVKTPSRNISCFYVPVKPTTHGTLLCDIQHAVYLKTVQDGCRARSGLDWHGFNLSWKRERAQLVCSGGILYDIGRDTPAFVVLGYGRTWHAHGFSCTSRRTGLTCTNGHGNGLFIARESYRLW